MTTRCVVNNFVIWNYLTNEVHNSKVKNNMGKDKVCKCSFRADFKLTLVGWIDLEPQAS